MAQTKTMGKGAQAARRALIREDRAKRLSVQASCHIRKLR